MRTIKDFVREEIKNMEEINWGEVPDNNPYRLLWGENQVIIPECVEAMKEELTKINLYPSATKLKLRQAIAQYCGVSPDQIVVTNGSDEALELIAKVFINKDDEVIMPSPSYPCFESVSQLMGAVVKQVPLEKDFSLDINKLIEQTTDKTKIIWIANPNNPTGNILLQENQIEMLAKKTKALIVVDECYFELADVTAVSLIKRYPQIIVTRSFSKVFSLAGVRLGYIVANKQVTQYLNRLEQTNQVFNVNRFALAAGYAVLQNNETVEKALSTYQENKDRFIKLLSSISSVEIVPTKTTFCLIKLLNKGITAADIKRTLLEENIYVKDCSIYKGLGPKYLYLGVPQEQYQEKVVKAIQSALL